MKTKLLISIAFVCLILLFFTVHITADETMLSLESRVIETFENDADTGAECTTRWFVRGSKFIAEGMPVVKSVKGWPEALHGKNREEKDYRVLGIFAGFGRKGYNFIDIIPSREFDGNRDKETDVFATDKDGKRWVYRPIIFPGRIRAFSTWVWGSNYNYYMEVHVKDHNGSIHVLPLGNLTFTGWKNVSIEVPTAIPQSETYIPRLKRLRIELIRIWTRPEERVTEFWLYLDQMKVLTDMFETRYDGDELEDEKFLKDTWGVESQY